jgi:hypothetical protein
MEEPVKPLTTWKIIAAIASRLGVEKRPGGLGGGDHFLGGTLAHALGIAVSPDIRRRIALWRSSMRSQTAWPTRWLEMA